MNWEKFLSINAWDLFQHSLLSIFRYFHRFTFWLVQFFFFTNISYKTSLFNRKWIKMRYFHWRQIKSICCVASLVNLMNCKYFEWFAMDSSLINFTTRCTKNITKWRKRNKYKITHNVYLYKKKNASNRSLDTVWEILVH